MHGQYTVLSKAQSPSFGIDKALTLFQKLHQSKTLSQYSKDTSSCWDHSLIMRVSQRLLAGSATVATKSLRCTVRPLPQAGKLNRRNPFGQYKSRYLANFQVCQSAAEDVQAPSASNGDQPVEQQSLDAILQRAQQDVDEGVFDLQDLGQQIQELMSTSEVKSSEELQLSKTEATNKYLRLSADFDNFRKRSASERERQSDQIRGDVIKQLIPLVDSFEAAQASLKADEGSPIASAYKGLYKQLVEIFKSLGVEAVPGAGQPFDPEFHDAILREENNEVPNGTVLQELRRGFRLGKSLLRPSMVKVSYSEEPSAEQEQPAS